MSAVLQDRITETDSEELRATMQLTPDAKRELAANNALTLAKSYEVDCAEQAQALANDRTVWAKEIDRIKTMQAEALAPAKKMLEDMKGWAAKWFGPALADREAARELAGQKLLVWDQAEKARLAREAAEHEALARRLRQEADSKAAAERARAEEVGRVARQAAAAAEEVKRRAQQEAEAARQAGGRKAAAIAERVAKEAAAEVARQTEKAQAAVENGEAKAQQAQLEAAAQVQAAPVAEVVKISGQSLKDQWGPELKPGMDIEQAKFLICEAIVAGRKDLLAHMNLDMAPRGSMFKMAAALKGAFNVPGFIAVNKPQIAGSRK